MSKTPLTDAKECRRPLYSRGEWDGVPVADYVPSAVSRELETDRAELVELLLSIVNNGKVSNEELADAQALLERINK